MLGRIDMIKIDLARARDRPLSTQGQDLSDAARNQYSYRSSLAGFYLLDICFLSLQDC